MSTINFRNVLFLLSLLVFVHCTKELQDDLNKEEKKVIKIGNIELRGENLKVKDSVGKKIIKGHNMELNFIEVQKKSKTLRNYTPSDFYLDYPTGTCSLKIIADDFLPGVDDYCFNDNFDNMDSIYISSDEANCPVLHIKNGGAEYIIYLEGGEFTFHGVSCDVANEIECCSPTGSFQVL